MMISTSLMLAFVFIPFFATSLPIFLVGQILMGIPWGGFQSLASAYASEVCPVSLRPLLTTYVNLCWVFGQLLAAGVLRATVVRSDVWAWRIPYALQFFWPFPVFITCLFAPESPWWLTRHGKHDKAYKSIDRLLSTQGVSAQEKEELVKDYQAMIQYTEAMEDLDKKNDQQAKNRYIDCFKGIDLRRTEIACWAWLIQITSGAPLQGFSTYFFTQAGMSTINAFNMTMAMYALGAVGTVLSWFLINHAGRRHMYLWGQAAMFSTMLVTGILGCVSQTAAVSWAVGAMLLICTFVYDLTIGPVCFAIIAEVSSTRLRSKTIVLACNTYNIGLIVANILQPDMLNSDQWNWGAKTGFFWAGTCAVSMVWTYFRLPELNNRYVAIWQSLAKRDPCMDMPSSFLVQKLTFPFISWFPFLTWFEKSCPSTRRFVLFALHKQDIRRARSALCCQGPRSQIFHDVDRPVPDHRAGGASHVYREVERVGQGRGWRERDPRCCIAKVR